MKEKDFYAVVSAIAQFIEKADSEPDENKNQYFTENMEIWRKENNQNGRMN